MTCVSRLFDSHRFRRCFPFLFIFIFWIPSNSISCLLAGNTFIHVSCCLLLLGLFYFCIFVFKSSVLVFCGNSVFWFVSDLSECGAYLAVDHSLDHSCPKMFLLFSSLILSLIPDLKPFSSIQILVPFSFIFLLLGLARCGIGILSSPSPSLYILLFNFQFTIHNEYVFILILSLALHTERRDIEWKF